MYVSAINSLSSNTQLRKSNLVSKTSASKSQPINFKSKGGFYFYAIGCSYKDAFKEAFTSFPKTRKDLEILYQKLTTTSVKGKNVQARKGNQKMFLNYGSVEQAIENVSKEENTALVLKNGEERVTQRGKKLEFKGEKGDYITFELDSNQQITFSQNHDDGGDFFKFFRLGNLASHKKVSGSGIAQSSTTTHYNEDGSTNVFKTFFSRLFGI